ncbi:hypothetical protein GCM10009037_14340 [Halarchaeum grantii]|uniref:AMP-binding enzyme n=1 Tax=Halarchaeum grantii TaxID=1193105 RepID=A0A830EUS8_9EURY|nr:hypothetical protein [Halarchaeum grantii]GGL31822.1 hypothetical protein GCM10009037_14340 [Halarchaeum grantii]
METVYELLADLPDEAALRAPPASLSSRDVRATAYKVGNYLRSRGVHEGSRVGVADDADPKVVLAFLGSALLAAPVTFAPPGRFDGRAVVVPTASLDGFDLGPGGQRVGYGAKPADPADGHFEGGVWSENPAFPPVRYGGDVPALAGGTGAGDDEDGPSQRALLDAAADVAAGLDADDALAVRASFTRPGTVVGVLGALRAGATVLLPDAEATGTVALADGDGDAPEAGVYRPEELF